MVKEHIQKKQRKLDEASVLMDYYVGFQFEHQPSQRLP
jgi:hypothetical protein